MKLHYLAPAVLSLLLCAGCGPKPLPQESQLDTASNHYSLGLSKLDADDLAGAKSEFARARQLDPNAPEGYVGAALVAMYEQDFHAARAQIGKALGKDGKFADAHVALGRIVTAEGLAREYRTEEWLKEALAAFDKTSGPEAHFYKGMSYKQAFRFEEARQAFAAVLSLNQGPLVQRAMRETEIIQRIQRAAPGSRIGMKIALIPEIDRADLAVLLVEELKLAAVLAKHRPATSDLGFRAPGQDAPSAAAGVRATDTAEHWAQQWIGEVLSLGVAGLDLFPDGTFHPDEPITRANYALVNQSIIAAITGDASIPTRYLGESSRFSDVRNDFYAYNAIAFNADRGIMAAEKITGAFRPTDPVSGADALLIIRELQNALRMEF